MPNELSTSKSSLEKQRKRSAVFGFWWDWRATPRHAEGKDLGVNIAYEFR